LSDFQQALAAHRPDLLRHCYRMLGSFADAEDVAQDVLLSAWKARDSYSGTVPLVHWLLRISTNACLNELARRRRRGLPQTAREAATTVDQIELLEAADWLTPAPDSRLFAPPAQAIESRESVALAFLALLQQVPPRQRAVLLLKDVIGWSAEEIATALDMTLGSVNSALHRARATVATGPRAPAADPPPDVLREYIRSWEARDLTSLVALLRHDVVFAMPPFATWFRGATTVASFLRSAHLDRFWSRELRITSTRACGQLALAFHVRADDGYRPHSIQLVQFVEQQVTEAIQFIGADYLRGFDVPEDLTVAGADSPRPGGGAERAASPPRPGSA